MEDVKKTIARVKKYFNCASKLDSFAAIMLAVLGLVFLVGGLLLNMFSITKIADMWLILIVAICLGVAIIGIALLVLSCALLKRAKKDTETLRRNCMRLKPISQGHFDFLSLFVSSPDKLTFLQGPKTDDEKTMIILIWGNEAIDSCDMREEEAKTIFEPMFK